MTMTVSKQVLDRLNRLEAIQRQTSRWGSPVSLPPLDAATLRQVLKVLIVSGGCVADADVTDDGKGATDDGADPAHCG
jgi:hypothetical protein